MGHPLTTLTVEGEKGIGLNLLNKSYFIKLIMNEGSGGS